MDDKQLTYDPDGYELVTEALRTMLDQYPGLDEGEKFYFSSAPTGYCKSIFPTTGAVIQYERESITGHVTQECMYPITVLFRASGLSQENRVSAKEWLDTLGRWMEKQTVIIDEQSYKIDEYPPITGTRQFRNMTRQTPAYLSTINEDKSEDWIISMTIQYRNEFDR